MRHNKKNPVATTTGDENQKFFSSNDTGLSYLTPPPYHVSVYVKKIVHQLDMQGAIPAKYRKQILDLLKKSEV